MPKTTLIDCCIKKYAYREVSQIYQELEISGEGLSQSQVELMREKYGVNSFSQRRNDTMLRLLRRAFINPFNIILLVLGIISLATDVVLVSNFARNATTAVIIFSMILISGTIRLVQELRAKNASKQLNRLIHESITVRRAGEVKEIPAEELVVGDIVLLVAGDRVPADLRLTKVSDLFLSQAAITGESAILEKNAQALSYSNSESLTQLENLAFMATTVISGKGEGIVLAVGKDTLYGSFTKEDPDEKQSFQKGANSIAWVMLRFIAVLIPIVFILLQITGGRWLESFAFALSVAVGLMPEMLPMVITACLARGSLSMSKKQTIIKDINAMQGFGSMDVLCMDKTGTLTNESILLEYYMDVLGNESGQVLDFAFLNSAFHSGVCNPIDNAILACQTMPGHEQHFSDLLMRYQKEDEIPFDYIRKKMSVVVKHDDHYRIITKGALEEILKSCTSVKIDSENKPLTQELIENINQNAMSLARQGMQVIALASKREYRGKDIFSSDDEKDMTFIGFVAFLDPPKKDVKSTIKKLKKYGITTKILTGDNQYATENICNLVGIPNEKILIGTDVDKLSDEELAKEVENVNVFARMNPLQKERIIKTLKNNGHVVGYMGDGVNDAPSLHNADVGICVNTATDIAKEASDIILLEKNLNVIFNGVIEGRKVYGNIIKYMKMALSSDFGDVFSIFIASIFLPFLPLLPIQMLIQDFLYDFSQIAIPYDNVDEEFLIKPKKWDTKGLGTFMNVMGPVSSIIDVLAFLAFWFILGYNSVASETYFQTAWFIECLISETLIIHFVRTSKIPFIESKASPMLTKLTLVTIIGTILTPILLHNISSFHFEILPFSYYLIVLALTALYVVLVQFVKKIYIKKVGEWL